MKLARLPLVQLMAFLSFFLFSFFLFWSSTLSRLRTCRMRELKQKHLKPLPDCQLFGIRCHLFACKIRSAEILTTCRHISNSLTAWMNGCQTFSLGWPWSLPAGLPKSVDGSRRNTVRLTHLAHFTVGKEVVFFDTWLLRVFFDLSMDFFSPSFPLM